MFGRPGPPLEGLWRLLNISCLPLYLTDNNFRLLLAWPSQTQAGPEKVTITGDSGACVFVDTQQLKLRIPLREKNPLSFLFLIEKKNTFIITGF